MIGLPKMAFVELILVVLSLAMALPITLMSLVYLTAGIAPSPSVSRSQTI